MNVDRDAKFQALVDTVQRCRRCAAMEGRRRVLTPLNGDPAAPCLVVAEAPGRLGAERTGIPLLADQTGRTFRRLCAEAGVPTGQLFITNAVVCNPQDAAGHNRRPAREELASCLPHLAATIAVIQPALVVSLGRVALDALGRICPHSCTLSASVGQATSWNGRLLLPLYHPGPQAMLHRPYAAQLDDYRRLAVLLHDLRPVDARQGAPC